MIGVYILDTHMAYNILQKVLIYLPHESIVTLYMLSMQPMILIEVPTWKYWVLLSILSTGKKNIWINIGWFPFNINKIGQGEWDYPCTCDKISQGDILEYLSVKYNHISMYVIGGYILGTHMT